MKQAPPTSSQPPPASTPALAPPNGLSSTPRLSFEAQIKRQPAPTATFPSPSASKLFADVKKNLYINRFCLIPSISLCLSSSPPPPLRLIRTVSEFQFERRWPQEICIIHSSTVEALD